MLWLRSPCIAALAIRYQPFQIRLSSEPFSLTYHWSTHLYTTGSFMTEANVQSYPTCSKRLILKANEKAVCSTDNHPKRIALDVNILQRLQSCSSLHWKVKNSQLSCHLTLNIDKTSLISHLHHGSKAPLTSYKFPPLSKVLLVDRADDNSIKQQCNLSTITSYQADYMLSTVS